MPVEFLTLAEGVTNDGRGALTLVGVNQRVIAPVAMPFNLRQKVVLAVSDELRDSPGGEFGSVPDGAVSIRVIDPSGVPVYATSEEIKLPPTAKRWPDLPLLANVIIDLDARIDSYGIYSVEVTHQSSASDDMTHRFPLYIVPAQVALNPGKGPGMAFPIP